MFFDFDFRPVRRLTGVTTGRRHGQWYFRLISRSQTLRVCTDATSTAATVIAVDATATANNVTGITIDATTTAVNATATAVDATTTVFDATAVVSDTIAAVIDANTTAVDDATDFRHRRLLLLPRTGMVVVLSAVARRYGRISRRLWRRRFAVIPTTDFRRVATSRHSARHRACGTSLRIATTTIGSRNRSERIAFAGSRRTWVTAVGRHLS